MNREYIEILMNRALDGIASREDKEELARALKADPLLKCEYDELALAHSSLNSLFNRLALPRDFNERVMKRVQPQNVPSDVQLAAASKKVAPLIQMPQRRHNSGRRHTVAPNKGKVVPLFASIGAVSAAAALLLVIGLLTGVIGGSNAPTTQGGTELQAEDRRGVLDNRGNHRTDPQVPRTDREASDGPKGPSDAPPGFNPPGSRIEGEAPVNPKTPEPEPPTPGPSNIEKPTRAPTPEPEPAPMSEGPVLPEPAPTEPRSPHGTVEKPANPETPEGPTAAREQISCGTISILNKGRVEFQSYDGKWIQVMDGAEIAVGANLRTSAATVALLRLAHGVVVMGKDTNVQLMPEPNRLSLVKGEITLERGRMDAGDDEALEAVLDGSTLRLSQGTTVIERRGGAGARKVEIHQIIGACSLTRRGETAEMLNGQVLTVIDAKVFDKPVSKSYVLEEWAGDGRAELVHAAVRKLLNDRTATGRQHAQLDVFLGDLMRLELSGDLTSLFLESVLLKQMISADGGASHCFKSQDLLAMLETVKFAMAEQKARPKEGMNYDVIMSYAVAALEDSTTVPQWQEAFRRLCAGPSVDVTAKASDKMQRKGWAPKPLPKGGMGG